MVYTWTFINEAYIPRLVSYLATVGKPFHFDGTQVEFDATENFMTQLCNDDKAFEYDDFMNK